MKKSAHSVPNVQGTGTGLGEEGFCVSLAMELILYSCIPFMSCFKSLERKRQKKKKKEGRNLVDLLTKTPHEGLKDGTQKNPQKTGEMDGAIDGDVSQIEDMSQTDTHSLLRETDREAAGRRYWLCPRLHKQFQLWT